MILRKYRAPRKDPDRNPAYLAWVRSLPCTVCYIWGLTRRQYGPVEAAHVGPRALSRKCSDFETIPLCVWHHRLGPQSHHAISKRFWSLWKLDRNEITARLNREYEKEKAA